MTGMAFLRKPATATVIVATFEAARLDLENLGDRGGGSAGSDGVGLRAAHFGRDQLSMRDKMLRLVEI